MDKIKLPPDVNEEEGMLAHTVKTMRQNALVGSVLTRRKLFELSTDNMVSVADLRSELPAKGFALLTMNHPEMADERWISPFSALINKKRTKLKKKKTKKSLSSSDAPQSPATPAYFGFEGPTSFGSSASKTRVKEKGPPVFFYNTLCLPDVLARIIGRKDAQHLAKLSSPAILVDHTIARVKNADFPTVLWTGDAASRLEMILNTGDASLFPGRSIYVNDEGFIKQKLHSQKSDGGKYWSWEVDRDQIEVTEESVNDSTEYETRTFGQAVFGLDEEEMAFLDRYMGCKGPTNGLFRKELVTIVIEVRYHKHAEPDSDKRTPLKSEGHPVVATKDDATAPSLWPDGMLRKQRPFTEMEQLLEDKGVKYGAAAAKLVKKIKSRLTTSVADNAGEKWYEKLDNMVPLNSLQDLVYSHEEQWSPWEQTGAGRDTLPRERKWTASGRKSVGKGSAKQGRARSWSRAWSLRTSFGESEKSQASQLSRGGTYSFDTSSTTTDRRIVNDNPIPFSLKSSSSGFFSKSSTHVDIEEASAFPDFPNDHQGELRALGAVEAFGSDDNYVFQQGGRTVLTPKVEIPPTKFIEMDAITYVWNGPLCELESVNKKPYTQIDDLLESETMDMAKINKLIDRNGADTATEEPYALSVRQQVDRSGRDMQATDATKDADEGALTEDESEADTPTRAYQSRGQRPGNA